MSILNLTFPNILCIQYKYLLQNGSTRRDELLGACAPAAVVTSRSNFNNTLNAARRLGIFEESNEGMLQIAADLPRSARSKKDGLRALPVLACRQLLDGRNNEPIWKDGDDDSDDADFTRAVSWALAQDIYSFPASGPAAERVLSRQVLQVKAGQIIQNFGTRWPGFVRWASFLGFGWGSFNIDPTLAIRRFLADVFDGRSTLDAASFIRLLGQVLPVLDGGRYRVEVEQHLDPAAGWLAPVPGRISSSLSLALERLHLAGHIELQHKADSPDPMQLTSFPGQAPKHVRIFTAVKHLDKGGCR
jgi:hypothetical protein